MLRYSAIISDGSFPCRTAVLQGDVEAVFKKAEAAGYDCVQLTIKDCSDYSAKTLCELSLKYGIKISAMATGRVYSVDGYSMASSNEENRRACLKRLFELADFSAAIGNPAIVIGAVRGRYSDAVSTDEYYRQFDKSLRSLVEYCERLEVPVILEVIERSESEAFVDPEETLRYVEKINSPILHMYLDVMHLYSEGFDVVETIRRYGRYSWQIDISGENRVAPMDSKLDFSEITRAIFESGFDGVLTFEMPPYPPENSAEKSLVYIKQLMKEARSF